MREILIASEGHIYTDGTTFGRQIHLAQGIDSSAFYEITEEEYNKIFEELTVESDSLF